MADQWSTLGTPSQFDPPLSVPGAGRKVAIPRLQKPEGSVRPGFGKESNAGKEKNRVSHACEPCRQRKTKVSAPRLSSLLRQYFTNLPVFLECSAAEKGILIFVQGGGTCYELSELTAVATCNSTAIQAYMPTL